MDGEGIVWRRGSGNGEWGGREEKRGVTSVCVWFFVCACVWFSSDCLHMPSFRFFFNFHGVAGLVHGTLDVFLSGPFFFFIFMVLLICYAILTGRELHVLVFFLYFFFEQKRSLLWVMSVWWGEMLYVDVAKGVSRIRPIVLELGLDA